MIVRLAASKDLIKIGKLIDAETKFGLLQNLGNSATFPALNNKKCWSNTCKMLIMRDKLKLQKNIYSFTFNKLASAC